VGRLTATSQLIHNCLTDGLLVRKEGWQDVRKKLWQLIHPLWFVSIPVLFTDLAGEARGKQIVLTTGAKDYPWSTHARRHHLGTGAAVETGKDVVVPQSLHYGMLWFPDEKWMELKVLWRWQVIGGLDELWLRGMTPQGDHIHQMAYRSGPWP